MSSYLLSPDALQDLQDIWDFVALDTKNAADQLEELAGELFRAARLRKSGLVMLTIQASISYSSYSRSITTHYCHRFVCSRA